jgi:hypothetical protein
VTRRLFPLKKAPRSAGLFCCPPRRPCQKLPDTVLLPAILHDCFFEDENSPAERGAVVMKLY